MSVTAAFTPYERTVEVVAPDSGATTFDPSGRPLFEEDEAVQLEMSVIPNRIQVAQIDAGRAERGEIMALMRRDQVNVAAVRVGARVSWIEGVHWEISEVEDYDDAFGPLGGFMRVWMKREEID